MSEAYHRSDPNASTMAYEYARISSDRSHCKFKRVGHRRTLTSAGLKGRMQLSMCNELSRGTPKDVRERSTRGRPSIPCTVQAGRVGECVPTGSGWNASAGSMITTGLIWRAPSRAANTSSMKPIQVSPVASHESLPNLRDDSHKKTMRTTANKLTPMCGGPA